MLTKSWRVCQTISNLKQNSETLSKMPRFNSRCLILTGVVANSTYILLEAKTSSTGSAQKKNITRFTV
jgi:hypothetical protein